MKILHLGDVHLGVELHGRPLPGKGYGSRVADFLAALDHALTAADECDLVLFPGDIYHMCSPTPTLQREFAARLCALTAKKPVVIIPGNHDLPNAWGKASSVDIFHALALPNLWVFRTPTVERIPTAAGDVLLAALPFLPKSHLCADTSTAGFTPAEVNTLMSSILADTVGHLADTAAAMGRDAERLPCVLLAHWTVEGASYGGFRHSSFGADIVLPQSCLCDPRFDYIALAHLHQHQAPLPTAVYPGSIERVDFGEEHEPKGFVVADVEYGHAEWKFRFLPARRFVTLDITGETWDDLQPQLAMADVEDAVVRVRYTLPAGVPSPSDRDVRQCLLGAHHIAGVAREQAPRAVPARETRLTASVTPQAALGLYLDSRPELAGQRGELERLGLELIAGVTAKGAE